MKLCKWVVGMILAVTLFALPAAGDGETGNGEVFLSWESVADNEGYTYVDDDGYSMLRFTVESEPVEPSAVLPARLLVVNCGTDGFNTEVEVEETCNTPSDDIKKNKNKCPNCGKQYNKKNVPRKCAGKITKTVDKWE